MAIVPHSRIECSRVSRGQRLDGSRFRPNAGLPAPEPWQGSKIPAPTFEVLPSFNGDPSGSPMSAVGGHGKVATRPIRKSYPPDWASLGGFGYLEFRDPAIPQSWEVLEHEK